MKIRQGFVSNSSASSFIIGIAKIIDIDKFRSYLANKSINAGYDINIVSKCELTTEKPWNLSVYNDRASVESFSSNTVTLDLSKLSPLDSFVTFDFAGNEDDGAFLNNPEDWELDYDIDLGFFNDNERKLYNMFSDEDSGLDISTSQVSYGAGRNG